MISNQTTDGVSKKTRRRRIREITRIRKPTFQERLEARAKQLTEQLGREQGIEERIARREITLVLSHMDRLRNTDQFLHQSLLQHELYLGTEIIQREPRIPVYFDARLPERDRLRDRLRDIDAERRRWRISYSMQMQGLVDRLAGVISRHEQVFSTG